MDAILAENTSNKLDNMQPAIVKSLFRAPRVVGGTVESIVSCQCTYCCLKTSSWEKN